MLDTTDNEYSQANLELVPKVDPNMPFLPLDLVTEEYMAHLQTTSIRNLEEAQVGEADKFALRERAVIFSYFERQQPGEAPKSALEHGPYDHAVFYNSYNEPILSTENPTLSSLKRKFTKVLAVELQDDPDCGAQEQATYLTSTKSFAQRAIERYVLRSGCTPDDVSHALAKRCIQMAIRHPDDPGIITVGWGLI
jgi:hypothetical protein